MISAIERIGWFFVGYAACVATGALVYVVAESVRDWCGGIEFDDEGREL